MTAERILTLHVEDDSPCRDLTKTCLERIDPTLTIVSKASVAAGLEQLEQREIDCIVSDYEMPHENGLQFLEEVRETYPTLPFILYTAKEPDDIAAKAVGAGVDDYFQKQVGTTQYSLLANKITTLVEKHNAERRLTYLEQQQHITDGGTTGEKVSLSEKQDSVSLAVVREVAAREDKDPVALSPPLYDAIDPDALDALYPHGDVESLTFTYHGYSITIAGDGSIDLHPL